MMEGGLIHCRWGRLSHRGWRLAGWRRRLREISVPRRLAVCRSLPPCVRLSHGVVGLRDLRDFSLPVHHGALCARQTLTS
jgi:hypothetical protein